MLRTGDEGKKIGRERERERSVLRGRDMRGKRMKKKKQIMLRMGDEGKKIGKKKY
jgi:hypothetical protein